MEGLRPARTPYGVCGPASVAGTAVKWFTVPDPTVQGLWKLMPGEGPWSGLLNATAVPFV